MQEEIWKDIILENFEGYKISNLGRIKSLPKKTHKNREIILKTRVGKANYEYVVFSGKNGLAKTLKIHRLVAETFIPNPDNLPCVNHKDENKQNNCVDNLEWCTAQYNSNYGTARQRAIDKISRRIIQKDLDNKYIKEWLNATEIKRELGFDNSLIHKCCKGKRKIAYGYLWEYKLD